MSLFSTVLFNKERLPSDQIMETMSRNLPGFFIYVRILSSIGRAMIHLLLLSPIQNPSLLCLVLPSSA